MDTKQSLVAMQEAVRRQQEESEQLAKQQAALIERIKAGETTGDPILDFVTVCWSVDERVYDHLKTLQDSLVGMAGQYIVVVETEKDWVTTGNGGGFGPSGYDRVRKRDISLGLLESEHLAFDLVSGSFGFKTYGLVAKSGLRSTASLLTENLMFKGDARVRFPNIQKILEQPFAYDGEHGSCTISVMVGNDNIMKWSDEWCGMPTDFDMLELLRHAIVLTYAPRETACSVPSIPYKLLALWRQVKSSIEAEIRDLQEKLARIRSELTGTSKRFDDDVIIKLTRDARFYAKELEEKKQLAVSLALDKCPEQDTAPITAEAPQTMG
ncbi:MAG: hypothetical protein WC551_03385 [Patescibacteria group bacterium]